jgi:uncharacterized membrane protein HdeD (DUF308 family)
MTTDPKTEWRMPLDAGLHELCRKWGWFLALGIALIVLGAIAVGSAAAMTIASVILFGWLLIVGGVMQGVHAFWRKKWSGFFIDLLTGVLYVGMGFMVVANPGASAVALTLLISMSLIVGGVFRIVTAVSVLYPNWRWLLVHGIASLVLGIGIWRQWPLSGLWVIGLFVGIELMVNGWRLIMLGLAAGRLPEEASA